MSGASATVVSPVTASEQYNRRNEYEFREQATRELVNKYDKRSNVIIPFGYTLGFTGSDGSEASFAFDAGVLGIVIGGVTVFTVATDAALLALTSTVNANTAAILSEASTRASADSAISSTVTTLTATVASNHSTALAAVSTEATARATADSSEASTRASADSTLTTALGVTNGNVTTLSSTVSTLSGTVSTLSTTVSSHTTSISSINGSITTLSASVTTNATAITTLDGRVSAFYGIEVNAMTSVASFVLLATGGGNPASAIILTATTVSINGNALISGTVVAAALSVSTLSSITADIGTVTAGIVRNSGSTWAANATLGVIVCFATGYMKVIGASFGTSSNLQEWWGPTPSGATVSDPKLSTLTIANSYWAQADDGKVYYGGDDLSGIVTPLFDAYIDPSSVNEGDAVGAGTQPIGPGVIAVAYGDAPATFDWQEVSSTGSPIVASPTSASSIVTFASNPGVGNIFVAFYNVTVTDSSGRVKVVAISFVCNGT